MYSAGGWGARAKSGTVSWAGGLDNDRRDIPGPSMHPATGALDTTFDTGGKLTTDNSSAETWPTR
jgi:hypothetical protein